MLTSHFCLLTNIPPLVGLIDEVLTKTWFLNETSSRYPNNSKLEFRKNEHIIRPQSTINNHQKLQRIRRALCLILDIDIK